jgi:hypothetical protein
LFVLPVFQEYVDAPAANNVPVPPEQMVAEFAEIMGRGFTRTDAVADMLHP